MIVEYRLTYASFNPAGCALGAEECGYPFSLSISLFLRCWRPECRPNSNSIVLFLRDKCARTQPEKDRERERKSKRKRAREKVVAGSLLESTIDLKKSGDMKSHIACK